MKKCLLHCWALKTPSEKGGYVIKLDTKLTLERYSIAPSSVVKICDSSVIGKSGCMCCWCSQSVSWTDPPMQTNDSWPRSQQNEPFVEGGIGIFGFEYFFDRFFGFCVKRLRFWCSMRFADFSFFSIWFSVFVKNTSGFSVLVPNVVFGFSKFFFPIWPYLCIQFCMRFSVLRFWMNFSSVLRFLVYPNAPLLCTTPQMIPEMIPKLDRKWSRTANDPRCSRTWSRRKASWKSHAGMTATSIRKWKYFRSFPLVSINTSTAKFTKKAFF